MIGDLEFTVAQNLIYRLGLVVRDLRVRQTAVHTGIEPVIMSEHGNRTGFPVMCSGG